MKKRYETVLFATDCEPGSRGVFPHALLTASLHKAKLHVLHVVPEVEEAVIQSVAAVMGQDRLISDERQHLVEQEQELRLRFMETEDAAIKAYISELDGQLEFAVRHGRPVAGMLDYAKEIRADIIIVGARRRGLRRPSFLGSVATRLLRRTHLPVLVIPPED
jgi:nucleotide-binding universal stress UspA family protein